MISLGPDRLRSRLTEPLPGPRVQARMAPPETAGRHFEFPAEARQAAVCVLLYRRHGEWHFPLTVRPSHLADHPGQISLPGGRLETGETAQAAALRELEEELGIARGRVEVLGGLSPIYVLASRFRVVPWVALLRELPEWRPSPGEVAEVLEARVDDLFDREKYGKLETTSAAPGVPGAPYWECGGRRVWGATAMILAELAEIVRGCREEIALESTNFETVRAPRV